MIAAISLSPVKPYANCSIHGQISYGSVEVVWVLSTSYVWIYPEGRATSMLYSCHVFCGDIPHTCKWLWLWWCVPLASVCTASFWSWVGEGWTWWRVFGVEEWPIWRRMHNTLFHCDIQQQHGPQSRIKMTLYHGKKEVKSDNEIWTNTCSITVTAMESLILSNPMWSFAIFIQMPCEPPCRRQEFQPTLWASSFQ